MVLRLAVAKSEGGVSDNCPIGPAFAIPLGLWIAIAAVGGAAILIGCLWLTVRFRGNGWRARFRVTSGVCIVATMLLLVFAVAIPWIIHLARPYYLVFFRHQRHTQQSQRRSPSPRLVCSQCSVDGSRRSDASCRVRMRSKRKCSQPPSLESKSTEASSSIWPRPLPGLCSSWLGLSSPRIGAPRNCPGSRALGWSSSACGS